MRKKTLFLIAAVLLCALLTACGHEHIWSDATCQAPKTCADCGTTEGAVADHNWNNATCLTPKTCAHCGMIEGTVADHDWIDATCVTPKTCAVCGITEGTVADHDWNRATCLAPKTCSDCGTTTGDTLAHDWNDANCQAPMTCTVCGSTEGTTLVHDYGLWGEAVQDSSGQWMFTRSCMFCGEVQTEQTDGPGTRKDHGSAGFVEGTTVIVSVFANDGCTAWNFETEADLSTRDIMRKHLSSATDWLTRQIGLYGVESRFIYDWEANPDLYYTCDFGNRLLVRQDTGGYLLEETYVLENIPLEALKEKYQAQNIIYIFYFNTDESNTVRSWAVSDQNGEDTEIINIYARHARSDGFYYMAAATFAHEILHCFGAPDLYYASETIPQDYVDYCERTASWDIMFSTNLGETVLHLFTELDAYYLGLIDHCDEVATWGLGRSTFSD